MRRGTSTLGYVLGRQRAEVFFPKTPEATLGPATVAIPNALFVCSNGTKRLLRGAHTPQAALTSPVPCHHRLKLVLKESGREKKRSRTILRVNLARAPLSSCPNTFSSLILNGTCPHRRYGSAKHVQWTCPMARVSALGCSGSALYPQVGSGCCHRTVGRG